MKNIFTILAILITTSVFAQAPQEMSYQAVVRNSDGDLVQDSKIGMSIAIIDDLGNNNFVYNETQTPSTNSNGLISINIGTGTTTDKFSDIDWANGEFYLLTMYDLSGGTNYTIVNTIQLLSVPYALHAKTAETAETAKVAETAKSIIGETSEINYYPQSASRDQDILVSFSGGAGVNFSEASPVALKFYEATTTAPIYPYEIRYVNENKIDVRFNIPWETATGTYNLIINPNNSDTTIIEKAFLIGDWSW